MNKICAIILTMALILCLSIPFEVSADTEENPVVSITLEDVIYIDEIDWEWNPVLSEVVFADGTKLENLGGSGITYQGDYYWVEVDLGGQELIPGGTYEVTGTLLGASDTFQVTVLENPVQELQVVRTQDKQDYVNLKGAIFRLLYKDGTYEEFSIKGECPSSCYPTIYSEKMDRETVLYFYGDTNENGDSVCNVNCFGVSCELPLVLKEEKQIESVSIREAEDKSIIMTLQYADGTSEEAKLLGFPILWPTITDGTYYASIFTDIGSFGGTVYANENSFSLAIFNSSVGDDDAIMSNTISKSAWFEVVYYMLDQTLYFTAEIDGCLSSFGGEVTEENIDQLIEIAYYEKLLYEYGSEIPGEIIRNGVMQCFVVDDIDLTLSEKYDPVTDLYTYDSYLESGEVTKGQIDEILYRDGIWTVTTVAYGNTIRLVLNEDLQIIRFSINGAGVSGDVDGDGTVGQEDAVYLLLHTMFGQDFYPLETEADFDKDGAVTQEDAVYLLLHTMFGENFYPIN